MAAHQMRVRVTCRLRDLRYSRAASAMVAAAATARLAFMPRSSENRLFVASSLARATNGRFGLGTSCAAASALCSSNRDSIAIQNFYPGDSQAGFTPGGPLHLTSGLLLAAPRERSRGVIALCSERDLTRLLCSPSIESLTARYAIYVQSAWSPPDVARYTLLAHRSAGPVYVGVSSSFDWPLLSRIPNVVAVPTMASDFLEPSDFETSEVKSIDILMVAGWGAYKRHWALFEALGKLPAHLRVVLVGSANQGRTLADVKRELGAFRVRQHVEFLEGLKVRRVHALQAQAKVVVQTSLREGACLAVTEAMMGDAPVVMLAGCRVGAAAHIMEKTGRLACATNLAETIQEVMNTRAAYAPRAWLEENASAGVSSRRMARVIRQSEEAAGSDPPEQIEEMKWEFFRGHYRNSSAHQSMLSDISLLENDHGVHFAIP